MEKAPAPVVDEELESTDVVPEEQETSAEGSAVDAAEDSSAVESLDTQESGADELNEAERAELESYLSRCRGDALDDFGDDDSVRSLLEKMRGKGGPITKDDLSRMRGYLAIETYAKGKDVMLAEGEEAQSLGDRLVALDEEDEAKSSSELPDDSENANADEALAVEEEGNDEPEVETNESEIGESDTEASTSESEVVNDSAERAEKISEIFAEGFKNSSRGRKVIETLVMVDPNVLAQFGVKAEGGATDGEGTFAEQEVESLSSVLNEVKEREAEEAGAVIVDDSAENASDSANFSETEPESEDEETPTEQGAEEVEQPISPEENAPIPPPPESEALRESEEDALRALNDLAERWGIEDADLKKSVDEIYANRGSGKVAAESIEDASESEASG